jgi:hypothetical protein
MHSLGILILDAHRSTVDILYTAAWARKIFNPQQLYVPLAGYVFYIPIVREIISSFTKKYNITTLPVYRTDELKTKTLLGKFLCSFYPSYVTVEYRTQKNAQFIDTILQEITKPSTCVVISPFGGVINFG